MEQPYYSSTAGQLVDRASARLAALTKKKRVYDTCKNYSAVRYVCPSGVLLGPSCGGGGGIGCRESNGMKQLALEVVARTLDPAQIRLLAEEFDRADNNNNGEVSWASAVV